MAKKVCFIVHDKAVYIEKIIEYEHVKGMAFSQKQKNVLSFHKSIQDKYPLLKILEISTKSNNPLGVQLSAFNLKLNEKSIESIYQSSKVFENDVQYSFLIDYSPREAHRFISDRDLGKLTKFRYNDIDFPLEPKSLFYDYIYIMALTKIPNIANKLKEYDIFTDIEFNEKRQVNCQARACAIYSYLLRTNTFDIYLKSLDKFKEIYSFYSKQNLLYT